METSEYRKMYEMEDRHWWFRGKRHLVAGFISRYLPAVSGRPLRLLDVGCGTGKVLEMLSGFGQATGCDFSADSLAFCHTRGFRRLARASAEHTPFCGESMDVVCLLDVLYHKGIQDDVKVLREIHGLLAPGGTLILTDSAFQFLYGPHDRAVHARQRYSRGEMRDKLLQAGFQIEYLGYFNFFLFPLAASVRLVEKYYPRKEETSDLSLLPGPLNWLLLTILRLEVALIRYVELPFGLSVCAVARKPA
ncbi:MAG: class I SAM-dependent methyltransferase [Magnetococcales bacterium]|nr:class I SAM-dependent methyltransferase [Magnetococcales bacterium]MBF0323093.1 class I SAM-dependent methyltransferase [Magnetococcales bacterium]